jgi:hypothetical protein
VLEVLRGKVGAEVVVTGVPGCVVSTLSRVMREF